MTLESLMTLEEVVEVLRVSASTVKRKAATGEIPCVIIGRRRLFRREAVAQFIDLNTRDCR
jgi:excisionase family DNA binding protein